MLFALRRAPILLVFALLPGMSRAAGILDRMPPETLGFAVIHNVGAADEKIQRVLNIFAGVTEVLPQPPLAFVKAATGLGEGLNESGDAMLALLSGDTGPTAPRPLLLVPVSDYGKFAASLQGDATGQISRVTIAGEEVLVARHDDYAMFMNVEHRPTMERLLAAPLQPSLVATQHGAWLADNDLAIVLLPTGVDALIGLGQSQLAGVRSQLAEQFSDPGLADMLTELQQSLDIYDAALQFGGAEIDSAAFGVAVDDAANVRIRKRFIFDANGRLAHIQPPEQEPSPLVGYADGEFVIVGGGPLRPSWGEMMARMCRMTIEEFPETYGFEEFDEQQWAKLEESWRGMMADVRSVSMILYAGEKSDPVYSNLYGLAEVQDSAEYLASMRQSMELWNELVAASTSDIKLTYEFEDVTVADKPALLMTADVAAAAADDNVPMVKALMTAMFGGDGKMRVYTVAADADTIVMGIGAEEELEKAVAAAISADQGLAQSDNLQTTIKLLGREPTWTAYVSPQGAVAWASRILAATVGQLVGAGPAIPEFPSGPPIGLAADLADGEFTSEAVVPAMALENIATYVKAMSAP